MEIPEIEDESFIVHRLSDEEGLKRLKFQSVDAALKSPHYYPCIKGEYSDKIMDVILKYKELFFVTNQYSFQDINSEWKFSYKINITDFDGILNNIEYDIVENNISIFLIYSIILLSDNTICIHYYPLDPVNDLNTIRKLKIKLIKQDMELSI